MQQLTRSIRSKVKIKAGLAKIETLKSVQRLSVPFSESRPVLGLMNLANLV